MRWWWRLIRRRRLEDQLERELRFHLDQHAADLVARGHTTADARREARLKLGGPEQVKENCRDARGTRWLEDLGQDSRHAFRSFRQKPGFAVTAILILSLGIGAATTMFAVVDRILLRPLSLPESDRLITLHGFNAQLRDFWGVSRPDFEDVRSDARSFTAAAWTYGGGTIAAPGEPEYVEGRLISAGLLTALGVAPAHGRFFQLDEDRRGAAPVAILSYSLWRRRFAADPSAVGTSVVFDGRPYTVIGIAPAGFQLSGDADVFTPLAQAADPRMDNREARFLHVVARLQPGVSPAAAQSEVVAIAQRLAEKYPKSNQGMTIRVHPLLQELVGDVQATLWLLLSAVGLVLLIGCVNIASLFLTRAISRERELAMRVALGAGRGRLIRQCLTESALLAMCGGLLGVGLAMVSLRPFVALWPGNLPRAEEIHLDGTVLCFAVGVSLLSGLLFGIAPALRVPLHGIDRVLRAGGRILAGGSRRLYGAFVIAEIALALVLLVCAGMLGSTILTLASLAPGINLHNVLTARFAISPSVLSQPTQIRPAWQAVLDQASRVPGVEFAALTDIVPMREGENSLPYRTTAAELPSNQQPLALASCVTPGYLNVMELPLREGRFFDEHDREGSDPVVVVDETLARRAFGNQSAVGRRLWVPSLGNAPVRIVGVVGHVRHWGLAQDDESRVRDQLYYPFAQVPVRLMRFFSSIMSIAVRTKTPPLSLVEPMQLQLRGAAGDQALYEVRTMEQLVSASLARHRFLLVVFGLFAGAALLLAVIGIYGVLAYLTRQRVPEIGVRVAMGATAGDVIGLVMRQWLKFAFPGIAAGTLCALMCGRVLRGMIQGMQPVRFVALGGMISLLLAASLIAGIVPALGASRIDPLRALREE